jgi:hypothetical protein
MLQWSGKVFKPHEHIFRLNVALSRGTLQTTGLDASSCPSLLAYASNETVSAPHFSDILARATIDLIAFREIAKLQSVTIEQTIGTSIADILAVPVPKRITIAHCQSS